MILNDGHYKKDILLIQEEKIIISTSLMPIKVSGIVYPIVSVEIWQKMLTIYHRGNFILLIV